jgi:hypothetical protein
LPDNHIKGVDVRLLRELIARGCFDHNAGVLLRDCFPPNPGMRHVLDGLPELDALFTPTPTPCAVPVAAPTAGASTSTVPPPPPSPPANPFHATQPASPTRSPGGNCDERDGGASDAGTGGGDGVDGEGGAVDPRLIGVEWEKEALEKSISDYAMCAGFKAVKPSSRGRHDTRLRYWCQQGKIAGKSQTKESASRSQPHANSTSRPATKAECCPWKIAFTLNADSKYEVVSDLRAEGGPKDHNAAHTCKLNPALARHNARVQILPPAAKAAIEDMAGRRMMPLSILECLNNEYPTVSLKLQDVANISRPIVDAANSSCAAVVQELLRKQKEEGYVVVYQ